MKFIFFILLMFSNFIYGSTLPEMKFYKKVFFNLDRIEEIKVADTISKNPINNKILEIFNKKTRLGFVREITTTTGCDSACLPVIYTSFYDAKGKFLKILSKDGLTKINHTPFTQEDYSQLEFILALRPEKLIKVKNPKHMTDGLTGETLPVYKELVVKGGAYSTLRILLYDVNTQNLIKSHLNKSE